MTSFDRYIRVLRVFLPRAERDDIISELREEYQSQIADQERTRGRRLTDAEQSAIVQTFGHPLATAARYWRQQHLIGPTLFPFYWPAVSALLLLNVLLHAVSAAVAFGLRQSMPEVFTIANDVLPSSFTMVGIATVAFAILERALARPRPFVEKAGRIAHGAMQGVVPALEMTETVMRPFKKRHTGAAGPRPDRPLAGLIASVVFVGWWLLALRIPSLMFLTAGDQLAWAPAMDRIYPTIVIASLLFLAGECLQRTSLHDSPLMRILSVGAVLADVMFLSLLITSDYHWVRWQATPLNGREHEIVGLVNVVLTGVMLAVVFGGAARWLRALSRRFRTHPPRAAVA